MFGYAASVPSSGEKDCTELFYKSNIAYQKEAVLQLILKHLLCLVTDMMAVWTIMWLLTYGHSFKKDSLILSTRTEILG